jgi:hypothetical protein
MPKNPISLSLKAEPMGKKPAPPGRVPVLSSGMALNMRKGAAEFRSTVATTEQRKRSQRVLLRVGTNVHLMLNGKQVALPTTTLSVHPEGALVVMKQHLPLDTRLVLEHSATKERVGCRVAKSAREMPEGFHVSVEFEAPAPDFWKIVFPPADWHPDGQ